MTVSCHLMILPVAVEECNGLTGGMGKSQCLVGARAAMRFWCSAKTKTMSRTHRLRQAKFGFDHANHSTEYPRLSKVSNPS